MTSFADLPPAERVALVEFYLAQVPALPGAPRFEVPTLEAMRRLQLALVDDRISDERLQEYAREWGDHLGTLSAHDADAARYELRRFVQILDGLRGPTEREEAAEA